MVYANRREERPEQRLQLTGRVFSKSQWCQFYSRRVSIENLVGVLKLHLVMKALDRGKIVLCFRLQCLRALHSSCVWDLKDHTFCK